MDRSERNIGIINRGSTFPLPAVQHGQFPDHDLDRGSGFASIGLPRSLLERSGDPHLGTLGEIFPHGFGQVLPGNARKPVDPLLLPPRSGPSTNGLR